MTPSSFLFFVLAPLVIHVQGGTTMTAGNFAFTTGQISVQSGNWTHGTTFSLVAQDSVAVTYSGTNADTTINVTTDSAARLLKSIPAQVVFIRNGAPGKRVTRQVLAKIDPNHVTAIRFEQGDALIRQYGDVAKNGVMIVTMKRTPMPAKTGKKS